MSSWAGRLGAALALAGALSASAAAQSGWFDPEEDLQKGREALFQKRYGEAVHLCAAVYLEDPANAEARRCLRESARAGAEVELVRTQREARSLRRQAERSHEIDELLRERRYLEAYDMIYQALESEPADPWARAQLAKVQGAAEAAQGGLDAVPDKRARDAAWGFFYLSQRKSASDRRARERWEEALTEGGANIPTGRIRRYLAWIKSHEEIARADAPAKTAELKPLAALEQINAALDELLK